MVTINGRESPLGSGLTLKALLIRENFDPQMVAVEVNRKLVKRKDHGHYQIQDGDRIEVFTFVGGG